MITVIMRTYNNEKFIQKAVESVIGQTREDFELVIIDDGSTDDTAKIVASFADKRIRIVTQKNSGAIESAYSGINNTKGKYITFLDADDEMKKNALEELATPLDNDQTTGFTYSDYEEVELSTKRKKIVTLDNIFNHVVCGMMFRKSIIDDIGFWDRSFLLPEYDFIIRVRKKYRGHHIKKALWIYNRHQSSMTADKRFVEKAKHQILEKYGPIEGLKEY